jgi:two-component system, NtrC family, sensor kinase
MRPSVLIVDDSLTVRMDLVERFLSAEFDATACDCLAAAREALAGRRFSLIVLDVLLPDGEGIHLLGELKGSPETASTPVILLSTETAVRDRVRGLRIGADDYIGKPYDADNLLARSRQLIGAVESLHGESTPLLLLIDDCATFREDFRKVLEGAGYRVVMAASGEEGLRKAVGACPSGIIVDGMLPGELDGADVIRRLKQDLAFRDTPCLLLTGSDIPGGELRALDAGADAYADKRDGTEFILAKLLALHRPTGPSAGSRPANLLGPKKLLTVDDSPTYLHALSDELRQEGYDVIPALSGSEAIELLEHERVDCILLDLVMPGMPGQEVCRTVKRNPAWRPIPLLILTSVSEPDAMVDGINAGADDYISKTSGFDVLKARVRAQLRRKQFEEENRSIREQLLEKELETARARIAQRVAEARAALAGELERKNREMEAFSYAVSHDLRAPLRAIQHFSRVLRRDGNQLAPDMQECMDRIVRAASRMDELIEALLELSMISRHELKRIATDISDMARKTLLELAASAPERQVEAVIPDGVVADSDPTLMRAVIDNLLANAWKFTQKSAYPRIELGIIRDPQAPPVYFVRDNGEGFDSSRAHRLFQPFQRLHSATEFPGTGIGLATVSRIIERHGGSIWAESQVGKGATFFFTLEPATCTYGCHAAIQDAGRNTQDAPRGVEAVQV